MNYVRFRVAAASLGLILGSLTACGSEATGGGSSAPPCDVSVAVGTGQSVPACGDLKLAVFLPGANNADLQSRIDYLKKTIPTIPGASMTIFDGKFDSTTQLNQIQNAIASGEYNAAIAAPVDGVLMCDALSKDAPAAGMLVVVPILAICGLSDREGDDLAASGTLAYVGGTQTPDYWTDYLTWIAKNHVGDQRFVVLTDPEAPFPLTANFEAAVGRVQQTYPDFQIVGQAATDLTVAGSFDKAQALLQAHPDATGIITMFSTETEGAVQALQSLGRDPSSMRIYDKGATSFAVQAMQDGIVTATSPERAVTSTAAALQAIVDARSGKQVPRFIGNDGAPVPADAPPSGFTVFTKDTLGDFQPEN